LGLNRIPQCSKKGRNGIPTGFPIEGSIVQPKLALIENVKAEALGADRFTLIIVLTSPSRGADPGSE